MEFRPPRQPPRPRRSLPPVTAPAPSAFDPVGAISRIWAGLEGEGPAAPPPGRRRATSRSSSRPRSQEVEEPTSTASNDTEEVAALRAQLRAQESATESAQATAAVLEVELERRAAETAQELQAASMAKQEQCSQLIVLFQEELSSQLAGHASEHKEHLQERLREEVSEELATARGAWAADNANQALQQQEFEKELEARSSAQCLDEAEQLRASLMHEFGEHEEAIRQLCRQRTQEELLQQARQQREQAASEHAKNEQIWSEKARQNCEQELQEYAQKHQVEALQAESNAEKEMQAQLELKFERHREGLDADAMEHLECAAVQAEVCQEAEQLVEHLEQQEARAEQHFQEQLANREALCDHMSRGWAKCESMCDNLSSRSGELEEMLRSRSPQLEHELESRLALEKEALHELYESRTQAHLEDCLAAMQQREVESEAQVRCELQVEMTQELARDKESQIARLQKLMEKKLIEGRKLDENLAHALEAKEVENAGLRQQVASYAGGGYNRRASGDDLPQLEELQKLLQLAHGENTDLRETIQDLRGEMNTQASEIQLLEDKVLDTLSGIRDNSRAPQRTHGAGGPQRASSQPTRPSEASRSQPGDIRRLPPQPKIRHASNAG